MNNILDPFNTSNELYLTDSQSGQKRKFIPLDPRSISMYVCGPTVYDYPHIGNARSMCAYDLLYRILINTYGIENVKYVRNITDVDDKIIDRAKSSGVSIKLITSEMTQIFAKDMEYLNCLTPSMEPKATDHIVDMIDIISKLIDSGFAYANSGHVYFEVGKFQDYYKLSGRSVADALSGARVSPSDLKKHPTDFVLWKPVADDIYECDAAFDSPWGKGRPGWHIECSAMSYRYLGQNFDIHGGGADLIFPHHTNEIAQSKCAFPGSIHANYWIHNGFLSVNGEKMSKSLNNFITISDLKKRGIPGETLRLVFYFTHYKKPLDFSDQILAQAQKTLDYWNRAVELCANESADNLEDGKIYSKSNIEALYPKFLKALYDDMNTALGVKIIHDYAKLIHVTEDISIKRSLSVQLLLCMKFLGLYSSYQNTDKRKINNFSYDAFIVQNLVELREEAKKNKDWAEADRIREKLGSLDIIIEDTKSGSIIRHKPRSLS